MNRRLNNRKCRQRYCLVGERSQALALLNAAQVTFGTPSSFGLIEPLFYMSLYVTRCLKFSCKHFCAGITVLMTASIFTFYCTWQIQTL